jgi:hypothetical protein
MVGEDMMKSYGTLVYLAGSASAEFFADIALSPFEAVKVAVQTRPGFAKGLTDGMPKIMAEGGAGALFKSLGPLWGRQIPYTMMKFGAFENTVVALYKYAVPKPREQCTKGEQLGVSFAAGYIAGVFCAAVSHPADNLVSKLNAQKGATAGDIIKQVRSGGGGWSGCLLVVGRFTKGALHVAVAGQRGWRCTKSATHTHMLTHSHTHQQHQPKIKNQKQMGWWNLCTRGLPLRIIMVGTLTGLQWGIYDAFKVYSGLPTTGAAPAPKK